MNIRFVLAAVLCGSLAAAASGQTTPDTPSFKAGATIFADYTYNESPTAQDADKNTIHNSSFNVTRAYINVTGNLNHYLGFRITPDIVREAGAGSSLNGSYTFRLKYAFAQFNLDDWTTKGSWVRFGLNQTPYIDYTEGIYRYRFQGPTFVDHEGFLTSSDSGASAHWNFPGGYGDVHAGFYNGEGYSHTEANNEKAFQLRASVRALKGLRITGFVDEDHYVESAKRERIVGQITYEHPWANVGFEYLSAKDQASAAKPETGADGYSIWATPRFGATGWEMLLRYDNLKPNKDAGGSTRKQDIVGVAYWFHPLSGVQSALMADYDKYAVTGKADDTRYAIHMLVNF